MVQQIDVLSDGENVTVAVNGALTVETLRAFRRASEDALSRHASRISVDLRQTSSLDSVGLGMLLLLQDKAHAQQGRLTLFPPPCTSIAAVFAATDAMECFDIQPSPQSTAT